MKKLVRCLLAIILAMVFIAPVSVKAEAEDTENLIGIWSGAYSASESDGKTHTREIALSILDFDESSFYGIFEYNIPTLSNGVYGSYYFEGTIDQTTGDFTLQGRFMIEDDGYYDHSSYSVYTGTFNNDGTMNIKLNSTAFVLTYMGKSTPLISPASVCNTYVGSHYGSVSGVSVHRNSTVVIDACTDNGRISGRFIIYPIDGADNQINGIYSFSLN